MKRILLGCTVAVVPVMSAEAADLGPSIAPVPYVPMMFWTGFYLGPNIGGGWTSGTVTDTASGVSFGSQTQGAFVGGGQIGYNYQISPHVVLGAEWFFDGVAGNNNHNAIAFVPAFGDAFAASAKADWLSTLTGRIGVTAPGWDHWLVYVKGGVGWAETEATVADLATGASFSTSNINSGWVAGVGLEWAFAPGWTVRLDYQYLGLNGFSVADGQPKHPMPVPMPMPMPIPPTHGTVVDTFNGNNVSVQTLTVGVNYLFNWSQPPVVARY